MHGPFFRHATGIGMSDKSITLIGVPNDCGNGRPGCLMGPDALRTAGIVGALSDLGHRVEDRGNLAVEPATIPPHPNAAIHHLSECAAWTARLADTAHAALTAGRLPIFLGGDHSMSGGTVAGAARMARAAGRELFVLWLDAHPDFHTLATTASGNLHGTPVAYFTGQAGFDGYLPALDAAVPLNNVCMMGIRSVDLAERRELVRSGIVVNDMRTIDEHGVSTLMRDFIARVEAANGMLHVSLDTDFLDPNLAPAVGTTVPGGATFREAHLVMELLHDSDLVTSMDIAELNPFLDERGRTAQLMVDLTASLFGRRVLDRPTRSF